MLKRLKWELYETINHGEDKTIAVCPIDLSPRVTLSSSSDEPRLRGLILAPEGAPMENYILSVSIRIHTDYPFKPPRICFENKVWHPRVRLSDGAICLPELHR